MLPRPERSAANAGFADEAAERYQSERRTHWDSVARQDEASWGSYYHERLAEIYRHLVPRGSRVLELGCSQGDDSPSGSALSASALDYG